MSESGTTQYQIWKAKGLCGSHGTHLVEGKCGRCARKFGLRVKRKQAEGRCVYCGKDNDLNRGYCCRECADKQNAKKRALSKRYRAEIIARYGGICTCCGLTDIRFLSIEHKNGGGRVERRGGGGMDFYRKLLKAELREDITVLCYNCNLGRQYNGGTCPHEADRAKAR